MIYTTAIGVGVSIDTRHYFHNVCWVQVHWLSFTAQYQALMRVRYPVTINVLVLIDARVAAGRARGGPVPSITANEAFFTADSRALTNKNTARHFTSQQVFSSGRNTIVHNETTEAIALLLTAVKIERMFVGQLFGLMVAQHGWSEGAVRPGAYVLDREDNKRRLECERRFRGRSALDQYLVAPTDTNETKRNKRRAVKRVYQNATDDDIADEPKMRRMVPALQGDAALRLDSLTKPIANSMLDELDRDVPQGVLGEVREGGWFAEETAVVRLVFSEGFGMGENVDVIEQLSRNEECTYNEDAFSLADITQHFDELKRRDLQGRYVRPRSESTMPWVKAIVNGYFGCKVFGARVGNVFAVDHEALTAFLRRNKE